MWDENTLRRRNGAFPSIMPRERRRRYSSSPLRTRVSLSNSIQYSVIHGLISIGSLLLKRFMRRLLSQPKSGIRRIISVILIHLIIRLPIVMSNYHLIIIIRTMSIMQLLIDGTVLTNRARCHSLDIPRMNGRHRLMRRSLGDLPLSAMKNP